MTNLNRNFNTLLNEIQSDLESLNHDVKRDFKEQPINDRHSSIVTVSPYLQNIPDLINTCFNNINVDNSVISHSSTASSICSINNDSSVKTTAAINNINCFNNHDTLVKSNTPAVEKHNKELKIIESVNKCVAEIEKIVANLNLVKESGELLKIKYNTLSNAHNISVKNESNNLCKPTCINGDNYLNEKVRKKSISICTPPDIDMPNALIFNDRSDKATTCIFINEKTNNIENEFEVHALKFEIGCETECLTDPSTLISETEYIKGRLDVVRLKLDQLNDISRQILDLLSDLDCLDSRRAQEINTSILNCGQNICSINDSISFRQSVIENLLLASQLTEREINQAISLVDKLRLDIAALDVMNVNLAAIESKWGNFGDVFVEITETKKNLDCVIQLKRFKSNESKLLNLLHNFNNGLFEFEFFFKKFCTLTDVAQIMQLLKTNNDSLNPEIQFKNIHPILIGHISNCSNLIGQNLNSNIFSNIIGYELNGSDAIGAHNLPSNSVERNLFDSFAQRLDHILNIRKLFNEISASIFGLENVMDQKFVCSFTNEFNENISVLLNSINNELDIQMHNIFYINEKLEAYFHSDFKLSTNIEALKKKKVPTATLR